MILPLTLIGMAILSAGVMAYGTEPGWAQYPHGIEFIMLSRRLEWPLVSFSLLLCITLIALVVAGKRRSWFLIGLAPVLALFAHRFNGVPVGRGIADEPSFVSAADAHGLGENDYVVGLHFGDGYYAYPYAQLFAVPVIVQSERENRLLLVWNAYANRAMVMAVGHDLRARDLEIVSCPANAVLIYDGRTGEFINGITGETSRHQKPTDVLRYLPTQKMTWSQWRQEHPDTQVLSLPEAVSPGAPTTPILPAYVYPIAKPDPQANRLVALVGQANPFAIPSDAVGTIPSNMDLGTTPVMLLRLVPGGPIIAFDRTLPDDLRPRFELAGRSRVPGAVFRDLDTNSYWSSHGQWLAGAKELKGKKLAEIPVDDGLYWGVMKFWYPQLKLLDVPSSPAAGASAAN